MKTETKNTSVLVVVRPGVSVRCNYFSNDDILKAVATACAGNYTRIIIEPVRDTVGLVDDECGVSIDD